MLKRGGGGNSKSVPALPGKGERKNLSESATDGIPGWFRQQHENTLRELQDAKRAGVAVDERGVPHGPGAEGLDGSLPRDDIGGQEGGGTAEFKQRDPRFSGAFAPATVSVLPACLRRVPCVFCEASRVVPAIVSVARRCSSAPSVRL